MATKDFERGFVCAVAMLVSQHDAKVEAADLLKAYGSVNWNLIGPYDRMILRDAGLIPASSGHNGE